MITKEKRRCVGCSTIIVVNVGGRGNIRRFCDRNCAQRAARKLAKINDPGKYNRIARLDRERRRDAYSDELLEWFEAGDREWVEGPSHQFSMAMIRSAVADLKAKSSTPPVRSRAAEWIRGDLDDELELPCRADTCFQVMRMSREAAILALGI